MQAIESNSYAVFFGEDFSALSSFLKDRDYSKIFFLVDSNTSEHCLPVISQAMAELENYDIIEVDPGEENKNIDYCIGIWQMLLDFGADRKSLLINVGGGVVTDMGGFAASTFKRGIDFIQVPTTLLSQVDASVGGKTGIDMSSVKNIIGTFTQPQAVFIHPGFLKTLDRAQLVSGFAEVVKHGLIADKDYYQLVSETDPMEVSMEIIHQSVSIKNTVVMEDPREQGLRKILNFGHTIGHAVETYSLLNDKQPLLHGEAVAMGMICESYLSSLHSGLPRTDMEDVVSYIRSVFPDYHLMQESYATILDYMKNDKKNESGRINFSLLRQIGDCTYNVFLDEDQIIESLDFYYGLVSGTKPM